MLYNTILIIHNQKVLSQRMLFTSLPTTKKKCFFQKFSFLNFSILIFTVSQKQKNLSLIKIMCTKSYYNIYYIFRTSLDIILVVTAQRSSCCTQAEKKKAVGKYVVKVFIAFGFVENVYCLFFAFFIKKCGYINFQSK